MGRDAAARRAPDALAKEDALGRARVLRPLLRQKRISAADFGPHDKMPDVLYALCDLLTHDEEEPREVVRQDAAIAYEFISEVPWPWPGPDFLGERDDLLEILEKIRKGE